MKSRGFKENRAFTLLEILVVIAILALLAAILFPVMARAKESAKKTVCLSNIRQLSFGLGLYVTENNDTFPASAEDPSSGLPYWFPGDNMPLGFIDPAEKQNWGAGILPYVTNRDVFVCPSARLDTSPVFGVVPAPGGNASYMYNGAVSRKSFSQISSASRLVVLHGSSRTTRDAYVQPTPFGTQDAKGEVFFDTVHGVPVCNGIDIDKAGSVHSSGDNYIWADAHAKYKRRTAMTFAEMGISGEVLVPTGSKKPNTTGLTSPETSNESGWQTWGQCDTTALP